MRSIAAFATLLAAGAAMAVESVGDLGAKPDIVLRTGSAPASAVNGLAVAQMLVALIVVVGLLKWGLPKLIGRMNGRIATSVGSSIKIEDSASFAAGNLYVVSVRGKSLLIAAGSHGVAFLADVTESEGKSQEEPAFFELLDQAAKTEEVKPGAVDRTVAAVDAVPHLDLETETRRRLSQKASRNEMAPEAVQAALDRLSRLTG